MPNKLKSSSELVSEEIRAELARQKKSVNDLAENIGSPISTIRRSVNGHRSFTLDELDATAAYLGIGVIELIRKSRNESNSDSTSAA